MCLGVGIGRRNGLKTHCPYGRVGSNPTGVSKKVIMKNKKKRKKKKKNYDYTIPPVRCHCGWEGRVEDMDLGEDGIDETIRCPICSSPGWEFI